MCETKSRSINVLACPSRWGRTGNCRCVPKCAWCGYGPHMAAHGPVANEPVGGRPYGHAFDPNPRSGRMICPICAGLGVVSATQPVGASASAPPEKAFNSEGTPMRSGVSGTMECTRAPVVLNLDHLKVASASALSPEPHIVDLDEARNAWCAAKTPDAYERFTEEFGAELIAEVARLRAALSPSSSPRSNRFDCPHCGRGIAVDEDGCCRTCGNDATVVSPSSSPSSKREREKKN